MSRLILASRVPGNRVMIPHPSGSPFEVAAKAYEKETGLFVPRYFYPVVSSEIINLVDGTRHEWGDIVPQYCGAIYFMSPADCAHMRTSCEGDSHENGKNAESFQANDAVEEVVSDGEEVVSDGE